MSRTVSAEERLAILLAWDQKCVWCWVPLFYNDMEIEHLIPKSTPSDELPELLRLHGLPIGYDVWATENLAPSCGPCNRGKGKRPPAKAPVIASTLEKARNRAEKIRSEADQLTTKRGLHRHLRALLNASRNSPDVLAESREFVVEVLNQISGLQMATADYRLASRWVTDSSIAYEHPGYGFVSERRVWLINPPGKQSLAVVLESPEDEGWYIQNAAETIADLVGRTFPGHVAVLHYDQEHDKPWGNFWMPIPVIDGKPKFGDALSDHPTVADSLAEAGVLPREVSGRAERAYVV